MSGFKGLPRFGISVASAATSFGFGAAKFGTKLGFGIARGISSAVATGAGTVFDYALTGGRTGAGPTLGFAVASVFNIAENLALAPILIGEAITSTSLVAANDSLDLLSSLFGNDEASFSLASFAQLVRREWESPLLAEHLPEKRYSLPAMSTALMAWAAIQGVTTDYHEKRWMANIRELTADEKAELSAPSHQALEPQVRVTKDVMLSDQNDRNLPPGASEPTSTNTDLDNENLDESDVTVSEQDGPVISAEVGKPSDDPTKQLPSRLEVLPTLRRLSRMALAGYGGAGMIFFGVPLVASYPTPTASSSTSRRKMKANEEEVLVDVVSHADQPDGTIPSEEASSVPKFSWWNVLLGRHDQDIFESYAFSTSDGSNPAKPSSAVIGSQIRMPRFWVLTDHGRKEVVLVLRGTMSFNELAVDLTCDPAFFNPATDSENGWDPVEEIPGSFSPGPSIDTPHEGPHQVHGGMLKMAQIMGAKGRPVHSAVRDALRRNKDYELVLCGHSLGAGIVGLLSMMWADPVKCLTVKGSGLPAGRRVSGYLIAPPCLMSKELCEISRPMLTSFVYSHDVVSRLSLGSIRDMTRAAMWLCAGKGDESPLAITKRAVALHRNFTRSADSEVERQKFLSLRKTLEANMGFSHLYPPGRVLWAIDDQDLLPDFRIEESSTKLRLFEVQHVDKVFDQIIFSRRMLGSHLPHQYERVVHLL